MKSRAIYIYRQCKNNVSHICQNSVKDGIIFNDSFGKQRLRRGEGNLGNPMTLVHYPRLRECFSVKIKCITILRH